jgi:alpha-amylase/alpha-mannosidase (GH57 family)
MWHMHQPQYRDALTGDYVLPWTYLHAVKDYSDMAAHLEQVPGARAVVNFTPVLIEQLQDYAARTLEHLRKGTPIGDAVLETLTDAPLPADPRARQDLAVALMRAQRERMIEPYPAYVEAAALAQSLIDSERGAWIADALLHDLSAWYHLAWLGETVRRDDLRVRKLLERRAGFDRADRRALLEVIADTLGGILPRFRALAENGRAELTVTPYGHPILPLLLDFRAARESLPASRLPAHSHYPGGEDRCAWHMGEALRVFNEAFGFAPRGCWPSEGAISRRALDGIDRFGLDWVASSANVLRGSLGAAADDAAAYDVPYRLSGQRLVSFYRDDLLSDLIGFEYSGWHGDDAAAHLVEQLVQRAERHAGQPDRCVLIALDGENAWEHYPYNGYWFLRRLYELLSSHSRLRLTTPSEFLASEPPCRVLERVTAGSWVHGTLSTWIGDAAKNAGWDLLCDAKIAFDRVVVEGTLGEHRTRLAERQLALCESSDWFWWFGDYNPADAVTQFDRLYRRQLTNLYRLLDLEPPEALSRPISVGRGAPEQGGVMRRADAG